MPTSKVMQAAGQLRPQEGDKEAALDLLRKKLVGCGLGITKSQIFLAIFALFHTTVFAHGFFHYYSEDEFVTAMARFGVAFPIASAAGLVLHIDLAILMFPVCRALMSVIRRRLLNNIIDLDHVVSLHKLASLSIVFFACIHTIAYCCSFARQAIQNGTGLRGFLALNITTGPGLSGHLMLLVLNVIAVTSLKGFRQARSKLFWSTHHLFILFLVLWTIHGSFCMIKTDTTSSCASMGAFWQYFLCGGATYLGERIMRAWYGRHGTPISKVMYVIFSELFHPYLYHFLSLKKTCLTTHVAS